MFKCPNCDSINTFEEKYRYMVCKCGYKYDSSMPDSFNSKILSTDSISDVTKFSYNFGFRFGFVAGFASAILLLVIKLKI